MDRGFNTFSLPNNNSYTTREFLESNTLIAKVTFLIFVLFIFVIILRLGISLLSYFLGPNDSPHIIDGMRDATIAEQFIQDPNISKSKTIYRSVNQKDGLEFTWSVWLFIKSISTTDGKYKHIFHKGDDPPGVDIDNKFTRDKPGVIYPNNGPGLYIEKNTNNLVVIMNTYTNIDEEVIIEDVPLNKWMNVVIVCKDRTLNVYINGVITQSVILSGVPKQNYGNVYVTYGGGFPGYISNLWYYNYALGTYDITNLAKSGPNTKYSSSNAMAMKDPNYLSLRWYLQ